MKRDLPSLNAIRMFEAAARTQSFTRAAAELHVTQGAVSRQIALLEEQLGCKLFQREGPKLKLSDAGHQYQSVVNDALETIRKGTAQIFRTHKSNTITVSLLPTFASYWFMPRMPDMEKALPEITLRLDASYRLVDFAKDTDIDVAIRIGKGNWPGLYSRQLTRDELFPFCSPELGKKIKSVEDLLDHILITDYLPYDEWHSWFKLNNVRYKPNKDSRMYNDTALQIRAAMDSLGVILVRMEFVKDLLNTRRLVKLFDKGIVSEFQYYFVCPPARLAEPNIKALHDWLLEVE